MERVPMTPAGLTKLQEELKRLKSVERPKIVQAIEEAIAHGDLSENAEYKYAKEKQGFIEGRIQEIDDKLARAEVIDLRKAPEKVTFGCRVRVTDLETDEEATYSIVGEDEVDVKAGMVSFRSPIARAMMGKEVTDIVEVNAPRGLRELEILEIGIP